MITAFGKDQPGIVRRFSQYLAGKDINITDLYGDRRGEEFVLIGQVEVPAVLGHPHAAGRPGADGPANWASP